MFGDYAKTTYVNGGTPAINQNNLNNAENKISEIDEELRRSSTFKFSEYKDSFFQRNTKEIESFQDYSEWTASSATLSNDTTNKVMNRQSVKVLEPDNTSGWLGMYKTITSLNLATFQNGESSSTSDVILIVFYISDIAALTTVQFKLGNDNSNNYSIAWAAASLATGWNIKAVKKSAFTTNGTPSGWNAIVYIRCEWVSNANQINKYVSFQYAQLVRDDSAYTGYPNAFQLNTGTAFSNVFSIIEDYYILYRDSKYNITGIAKLNPVNDEDCLYLCYAGHSFMSKFKMICTNAGNSQSVVWKNDDNNYIEAYISSNTLYLYSLNAGTPSTKSIALKTNLNLGDEFNIYLEKNVYTTRVILEHLGEYQILEDYLTIDLAGNMYLGGYGTSSYSLVSDFTIATNNQGTINLDKSNIGFIKKYANEIVNNSTSLQNDDDFLIRLDANSIYEVEAKLHVTGNASADFKCDWVVGGGTSQLTTRACIGPATTTADSADNDNIRTTNHNLTTSVSYGTDGSAGSAIIEKFLVQTNLNSGTLQFRWAQNTANASDTTLSASSYIKYTKVA